MTTDLPNGYYTLPPGRLANAVVWLEMRVRPTTPLTEPLRLVAANERDGATAKAFFAEVGTPWLWTQAFNPSSPLPPHLHLGLDDAGRDVGVVGLAKHDKDVEITYFGLAPSAIGQGLGRRLMSAALDLAWRTADRVWLHTCSFDHPSAIRFYQSCGFVAYAQGFEIMDDPRLTGRLQHDAAPHVPIIRGDRLPAR